MWHPSVFLLLVAVSLAAADPPPGTYQLAAGGQTMYLTIDHQRVVLQTAHGQAVDSFRPIRGDGGFHLYRLGTPSGARLLADTGGVALVTPKAQDLYEPCPIPPEAIGWQPYELPPSEPDAGKRKEVANELQRRFKLEQRLRQEAVKLSGGRMDYLTMQKPEVEKKWQEANAADADNQRWLLATLRSHGWIGRKSHGAQAHQAVLLIALHNVGHLRLGATVLAQLRGELERQEVDEMAVANITDRFALVTGDPLSYGIQATVGTDGKPIIPILADAARVDANRKRIGQPPLAPMAAMMQATVVRIGDDGRLVEGGAAELTGLDAIDFGRARADPAWGLAEAGKADAALGAAIAAARGGDAAPLSVWCKQAAQVDRELLAWLLEGLGQVASGVDTEAAVVAERALLEGYLGGLPARVDGRIVVGNLLAYALVARSAAPNAEELARAIVLAKDLEAALKRDEIALSPRGHGIADTIACVRYREGNLSQAVAWWNRAIELAGAEVPDLYRNRLAAAMSGDAGTELPRK